MHNKDGNIYWRTKVLNNLYGGLGYNVNYFTSVIKNWSYCWACKSNYFQLNSCFDINVYKVIGPVHKF